MSIQCNKDCHSAHNFIHLKSVNIHVPSIQRYSKGMQIKRQGSMHVKGNKSINRYVCDGNSKKHDGNI